MMAARCSVAMLGGLLLAAAPGWGQGASAGITGITKSAARLTVPPESSADNILRYGLGFPFQVAPGKAAVSVNLRVEHAHTFDYEFGSDVVVFDSLEGITADGAVPISRNERFKDPATGADRIAIKYPVIGGFVPIGAKRADGSPHPYAGTGFGICQSLVFPTDKDGLFSWDDKFVHSTELHQFAYDGTRFTSQKTDLGGAPHPVVGDTGWTITAPGIVNAIPDGDDLLWAGAVSGPTGGTCGMVRWRCEGKVWKPVACSPVTPANKGWSEPSLVRDADGSLLYGARGAGDEIVYSISVWRSTDGGATWTEIVQVPDVVQEAPVSIGRAVDGTPFIAACLKEHGRELLCMWPLNPERNGLRTPLIARPARTDFGAPPAKGTWMVDHPSTAVVQLSDGRWHSVMAYRILQTAEFSKADPAPQSGCYLEEVLSLGEPVPTWNLSPGEAPAGDAPKPATGRRSG